VIDHCPAANGHVERYRSGVLGVGDRMLRLLDAAGKVSLIILHGKASVFFMIEKY
jgi:hypothetical protein